MNTLNRRTFLASGLASTVVAGATFAEKKERPNLHIAPFRFDVTPPMGHSLCGGWIKPVIGVDDPLEAIGYVLLGAGKPIVICAVDWTGILNSAHIAWRKALAEAADTTPDRVAVHCVHQHNAPFACLDAQKIVGQYKELPHIVEVDFFRKCLDRARLAVETRIKKARKVTHIAKGQCKVSKVASNRRVHRSETGKILAMRGSSCRNEKLRALPEGLIDPYLKSVTFYDGDERLVACHYYATHPMSYYGDGRVSSDFAGIARRQAEKRDPKCVNLYFTGCAGNIAAGKYNDGSKHLRKVLAGRMTEGILISQRNLKRETIESLSWRTTEILPIPRAGMTQEHLKKQIANEKARVVQRNRPSYQLAWMQRLAAKIPIVLSALSINDISMVHLPAESFIEYQLRAQKMQPEGFVACAAYGDGGPWYIPTKEEYPNGGYEVSVAFSDPKIDGLLTKGMAKLLG